MFIQKQLYQTLKQCLKDQKIYAGILAFNWLLINKFMHYSFVATKLNQTFCLLYNKRNIAEKTNNVPLKSRQ